MKNQVIRLFMFVCIVFVAVNLNNTSFAKNYTEGNPMQAFIDDVMQQDMSHLPKVQTSMIAKDTFFELHQACIDGYIFYLSMKNNGIAMVQVMENDKNGQAILKRCENLK